MLCAKGGIALCPNIWDERGRNGLEEQDAAKSAVYGG